MFFILRQKIPTDGQMDGRCYKASFNTSDMNFLFKYSILNILSEGYKYMGNL